MQFYELVPVHDARKSFYGKALVRIGPDTQELYSYGTLVASNTALNGVTLYPQWDHSPTTLRHVKEFLKQNNLEATTKKQMAETYLTI